MLSKQKKSITYNLKNYLYKLPAHKYYLKTG